ALVVAGYLGSLGLTANSHRGSHSVLRRPREYQLERSRVKHRWRQQPQRHEPPAPRAGAYFIDLGSRSHSAYPQAIATLGAAHSRVRRRSWLTAAELALCARRPHWSTSARFICPPFT